MHEVTSGRRRSAAAARPPRQPMPVAESCSPDSLQPACPAWKVRWRRLGSGITRATNFRVLSTSAARTCTPSKAKASLILRSPAATSAGGRGTSSNCTARSNNNPVLNLTAAPCLEAVPPGSRQTREPDPASCAGFASCPLLHPLPLPRRKTPSSIPLPSLHRSANTSRVVTPRPLCVAHAHVCTPMPTRHTQVPAPAAAGPLF